MGENNDDDLNFCMLFSYKLCACSMTGCHYIQVLLHSGCAPYSSSVRGNLKVSFTRMICRGRLWRCASLSIGAHWGTRKGDYIPGTLKNEWIRALETQHLSERAPRGEPGGRTPLLGTRKDMPSKALEIGICFHMSPCWGTWGLLLSFERRVKFNFIRRTFIEEFNTCNRRLWKRATLSKEAPIGKLGAGWFTGTFDRRRRSLEIEHL